MENQDLLREQMKTEIVTLKVDLTNSSTELEKKDASALSLEEKLGGFGKAVRDQERNLFANPDLVDAFDPRNILNIDIGFATGSNLMTSRRTYISAMSPLKTSKKGTNGVMYSAASGDLGPAIRLSGLDSIQLAGKHEKPVYLLIERGKPTLVDAKELVGKTTHDKIMTLASKHNGASYAVVGPAAENRVRYAGVAFSTVDQVKHGSRNMRFAGRGGFGAVLADKNVLGIVVYADSNNRFELGDLKELNVEIAKGSKTKKYRGLGTFFHNIPTADGTKSGIYNNFSHDIDQRAQQLFKETLLEENYRIADKGCLGCGIKCWKEIQKDGIAGGKIDYEPGSLLGPNLGIFNIENILGLVAMADSLGMDAMSAGVCIGYEMDKQNKFGDFELAKDLMKKIGNGDHPLKDGIFRYAGNAPNAMHAKGIEFAGYLGNLNPGYAFAVGGGHMTMDTYNSWSFKDALGSATNSVDEWVENIIRGPQIMLYDMNGICKFAKVDFDHVAELYDRNFEKKITADDLRAVAKLVHFVVRKMDESRGFGPEDDVLPANCHKDLGFIIPHFNTEEFFAKVKDGVHRQYAIMDKDYKEKGLILF